MIFLSCVCTNCVLISLANVFELVMSLDGKNSTAPEKTLKKHVFLGLKKNTKKHQGAGRGGGGLTGT